MKRLLLIVLLALPTVGIANLVVAQDPLPRCLPCPPSAQGHAPIVQAADAR